MIITIGITLATLSTPKPSRSRPARPPTPSGSDDFHTQSIAGVMSDNAQFAIGIALLALALFLSAFLGLYQEETYRWHGTQWREGLFYTVSDLLVCSRDLDPGSTVAFSLAAVLPPALPEPSDHPVIIRALSARLASPAAARPDRRHWRERAYRNGSGSRPVRAARSGRERLYAGPMHRRSQSPHLGTCAPPESKCKRDIVDKR